MKAPRIQFAMTAVVAVALAASLFAGPAEAGRGNGRGKGNGQWKNRGRQQERVVVVAPPRRVVYARPRYQEVHVGPSFANLVLAGVIGGVQVSARFGDSPNRGYGYWDPYCDVRFSSLNAYQHHCGAHRHPYQLRVFAVAPGHNCNVRCDHDGDHDDHDYDNRTWDRDDGRDYDNRNWERDDDRGYDEDWNRR